MNHLVIIQTPLTSKSYTQVTCWMSDEEFSAAKLEKPDLEFKKLVTIDDDAAPADVLKVSETKQLPVDDETKGITVKGMTLPHNLDDLINHLFEKR